MVLNVFSGVEGLQRRRNGFQMVLAKAEKRNGLYFAAESHSALNTHKYLSPFQVVKFTYMFEAFFDTKKVTIFTRSSFIFVKWLDYYTIFPFRMDDQRRPIWTRLSTRSLITWAQSLIAKETSGFRMSKTLSGTASRTNSLGNTKVQIKPCFLLLVRS